MVSPCFNCTKRHVKCHSKCEAYVLYDKANKRISKVRLLELIENDFIIRKKKGMFRL